MIDGASRLQINEDLDELGLLRNQIEQMTLTYVKKMASLLRKVQERGDLETVTVLADFLKKGHNFRWSGRGWETADTGLPIPARIAESLYGRGFSDSDVELVESDIEDDRPEKIIAMLLSNRYVVKLPDNISKGAFRANQRRAYFQYLTKLLKLYQEHSMLRNAVSYSAVLREKTQVVYHFSLLYFAGILHLVGISETRRIRIAQVSLHAIVSLTG
jgi:hypothetical protein